MPEGPEVWILAQICQLHCFGKHLFVGEEDWSFGLSGKVMLDDDGKLHKINSGYLPGNVCSINSAEFVGVDWFTATEAQLHEIVNNIWKLSKKMLAALLLDQHQIAGIGVAWASEICAKSGLNPEMKAYKQDLSNLVNAFCEIREEIKKTYMEYALSVDKQCFINNWYESLTKVRTMTVYKNPRSTKCIIGGRTWWVIK